jgi:signal transduction histidine kinase
MDSNERLIRAVQRATRTLAGSGKFNDMMRDVLAICVDAVGAAAGTIYLHDRGAQRLVFQHVLPKGVRDTLPALDIADDFGVAGKAFQSRHTVLVTVAPKPDEEKNDFERATGISVRSMLATPLSMEGETPIGVVQLLNKDDGDFTEFDVAVLDSISAVATMAFVNARLGEESARAQTLLGMGKVSHDVGNLAGALFANLSVADMALHGIETRVRDRKFDDRELDVYVGSLRETVQDLGGSIGRIVGYSRLISDLTAGRPLQPEWNRGNLGEAVLRSAQYFEAQGRAAHVAIRYDIESNAPETYYDDLFVFRIVQNLVGNAIKAVQETFPPDLAPIDPDAPPTYFGEVAVRYGCRDRWHCIEVDDAGPGMPADVVAAIMSGSAESRWERSGGSGWGTKIVRELTAALGGELEIESELGQGTRIRISLPHRSAPPAEALRDQG